MTRRPSGANRPRKQKSKLGVIAADMQSARMPAAITAIGGEAPKAAADRRPEKADGSMPIARSSPSRQPLSPSVSSAVNAACKAEGDLRTGAARAPRRGRQVQTAALWRDRTARAGPHATAPQVPATQKGRPPSERPFAWFALIKHRLPNSRCGESHPWEPPNPA